MKYFMTAFFCLLSLHLSAQDKAYHGDGIDNGLRWVPVASVVVLKACGVESASSWKRLGVNALSSIALSSAVSWGLKKAVNERRPDGTDNKAFPSGHATIAFAGAHILYKEYGRLSPWISVAGYGVATATAIDRVCRNRHHWWDVCAGAAIGILGTEAGYRIGDLITGERSRYSVAVGPDALSLVVRF